MLYTSSTSVYGNPRYLPINEDDPLSLLTPYAVSKLGGENYCMAFFESYGTLCGDTGVEFLDGLLNSRRFLGKREPSELRACAAVALGKIGTDRAMEALRRSGNDSDVIVRNAVSRSAQKAREAARSGRPGAGLARAPTDSGTACTPSSRSVSRDRTKAPRSSSSATPAITPV